MFKYKWDNMQKGIVSVYIINVLSLLYFPYRYKIEAESTLYGYESFLHWVIILITLRIALHVFGLEIYNMKANLTVAWVVMVGATYFKIMMGRKEASELIYQGIIIPVITLALFTAVIVIDLMLYTVGKKEET